MKLFECQACGQPLYFENARCESCSRRLGFVTERKELSALEPAERDGTWIALAAPEGRFRFCTNADHETCNWLVPAEAPEPYCAACRHNRTIPDLSNAENATRWRRLETAKHRLFYTILKLRLRCGVRPDDPGGLAFDLLADPAGDAPVSPTVLTGHDNGLITINIAEADDAERERRRRQMGEPYRTLLGHFRHEVGHYFWTVLVENDPSIDRFRELFGDERQDYGAALQAHYANGPPSDWDVRFISAYASSHPWEDWAETWAHYLHMVDTLETANAFGLRVRPRVSQSAEIATTVDFDPHRIPDLDRLVTAWLPLTFAVNSLNRSMGQPDLYPFVPAPPVIAKLAYVHERIHAAGGLALSEDPAEDVLRAVAAGLRSRVAQPPID